MSNRRKAYLRAMERAVFGDRPVPRDVLDLWRPGLVAALDEVEPLIRADEREQAARRAEHATTQHEFCLTDGTVFDTLVSLNEVCGLINPGGGDGNA